MLLAQYNDNDNDSDKKQTKQFPYLRRSSKNRSVQLTLGNIAELTFGKRSEIVNIEIPLVIVLKYV
jgi:hypothetical protein